MRRLHAPVDEANALYKNSWEAARKRFACCSQTWSLLEAEVDQRLRIEPLGIELSVAEVYDDPLARRGGT